MKTRGFTISVALGLGLVLALFLIWPLADSVRGAFVDPAGRFTFAYVALVFQSPLYREGFRNALAIAADAYQAENNTEKANEYLVRLLAAEPNNASLAQRVVDALAASRQYDVAKRIVEQAVQNNPGDLGLLRLRFLILAASGDFKPAIAAGEELVQLDTAAGDLQFWKRLSALYLSDSNATGAVAAATRDVFLA